MAAAVAVVSVVEVVVGAVAALVAAVAVAAVLVSAVVAVVFVASVVAMWVAGVVVAVVALLAAVAIVAVVAVLGVTTVAVVAVTAMSVMAVMGVVATVTVVVESSVVDDGLCVVGSGGGGVATLLWSGRNSGSGGVCVFVVGCGSWGRSWGIGVDGGSVTAVAKVATVNWASESCTVRLSLGGFCGQLGVFSGFWSFCSSAPRSSSSSSSSPPGSLSLVGGSGTSYGDG